MEKARPLQSDIVHRLLDDEVRQRHYYKKAECGHLFVQSGDGDKLAMQAQIDSSVSSSASSSYSVIEHTKLQSVAIG